MRSVSRLFIYVTHAGLCENKGGEQTGIGKERKIYKPSSRGETRASDPPRAQDGPRNFLEDCARNPRWSTLSGARALNDTRVRGGRD